MKPLRHAGARYQVAMLRWHLLDLRIQILKFNWNLTPITAEKNQQSRDASKLGSQSKDGSRRAFVGLGPGMETRAALP